MAETDFTVIYDGPALADGRIAVRDLAPALLALGEVFTEASRTLYADRQPPALEIEATGEGSFEIHLILAADAWDRFVDLFGSDGLQALKDLKELLIGSSLGLFGLIQLLRGRRVPKEVEPGSQPGSVRFTIDNVSYEAPEAVVSLARSFSMRRKIRSVVEPLESGTIERVEFRYDEQVTVSIGADEAQSFEIPEPDEEVTNQQVMPMTLSLAQVAFRPGNKWRLSDGERVFWVTIADESFLGRVERNEETFGASDLLRCRVRIDQWERDDGSLHTEHTVEEVVDHIQSGPPLSLIDLDESSSED